MPHPAAIRPGAVRRHMPTLLVAALAGTLTVAMVAYPDVAFRSAVQGLRVWWDIVFPALLPFFIAGQVLMALGVVRFLGVLLEPFMRPLFNVPGVGGFVVAMGLASGYPVGSVLTAKLRRDGQLTVAEAERLMSFTNTADPLFMSGAVAVGMFGDPRLAGLLIAAHYLGALATGLVLRFWRRSAPASPQPAAAGGSMLRRALAALVASRRADGRPLGQVFGDSVRDSVNTLLLIGGFIILSSVVIQILGRAGVVPHVAAALAGLLAPAGLHRDAAGSLVSGFFEITIGTQAAARAAAPLLDRAVLASMIIAWSGLSVLGQVAAVTEGTGVSMLPYVGSRLLHAAFAGAFTALLWNPTLGMPTAVPAMAPLGAVSARISWLGMLEDSSGLLCVLALALATVAVACLLWRGVRVAVVRTR